jgi:hypothetical protein
VTTLLGDAGFTGITTTEDTVRFLGPLTAYRAVR